MAALGIPPLIWLGARRSGWAPANALAWPGIALLEVVLMLSYSRGSLLALAAGLLAWFAIVPLRLRGAIVFLGATAGAAPLIFWAFTLTGLTTDKLPLAVREDAGHELGALTLVMLVALLALGLVAGFLAVGAARLREGEADGRADAARRPRRRADPRHPRAGERRGRRSTARSPRRGTRSRTRTRRRRGTRPTG